ncbi:MAG: WxcM-like domain-containing protein [Candidatus Scalindua sp.]|nr:WxcM-like domain-containing protein [Candidatus Scalindua sp.]
MEIIQKKKIEFYQDGRGWTIKPISEEEMASGRITNIHIASMKPGAVRGNHYHLYTAENIIIVGSICRITVRDNTTKQKEEVIIENSGETLLVFSPFVTHAIENIGTEVSYLFCYSSMNKNLGSYNTVKDKIV